MKTSHMLTYTLQVFQHPGRINSFTDWASFKANFQVEFFLLNPAKTAALSLWDQDQYGQGKHMLNKYIDSFKVLVKQAGYLGSFQLCLTF